MEFSERPLRGGPGTIIVNTADRHLYLIMGLMSAIGTKRTSPSALHMLLLG
jgi:hypothetical protein